MQPIVIVGPTSSGKTALSFAIAEKYPHVDILVVDSKQVYREQDIVTGKDLSEKTSARIFGIDLVRPDEQWSVADFVRYAKQVIENSQKDDRFLIIVVGTPQYFLSLIDPPATAVVPQNQKLRAELDQLSVEQLQQKVDPKRLVQMNNSDRNNPRRLIRAIEVSCHPELSSRLDMTAEGSLSERDSSTSLGMTTWIGLKVDKENLENRIRQRVIDRIEHGAVEEYKKIEGKYPNWTVEAKAAIGYQEIEQYVQGRITKEELISFWTLHEIQYARRQMQWWKKRNEIQWFDALSERKKLLQWVHECYTN